MKLRSIVFLLLVLFAGIVANAKTLKLSKNIIYEGAVQKGKPKGQGCLSIRSCHDKNITFLTINGDFNNSIVKNASIKTNGGIVIDASEVKYYKIATPSKKEDVIEFHMYLCSIKNNKGIEVTNNHSTNFVCKCDMKADKRWHFFADNNSVEFPITHNGIISSNFVDYNTPLLSIGEDASDIKKQEVKYRYFVTVPENTDEALDIEILSAQKTYLYSGVEIEHKDNSFYCKYPNGNSVVLNKDGSINNYKIALEGGRIEFFSSYTTITYDDGKTFTSSNAHAIETTNNILLCKRISDIKIKNGTLSYKDRSSEIYENGFVTASKVYLQDGGFYTTRKNGCNELTYPDGSVFKANKPNGLILHKSDSIANSSADYVLLSGILTNSKGKEMEYRNGMPHYKYVDDLPQSSNLFQTNDRFSGAWDININGEKKMGMRIMGLYKNDVVAYLEIADVKTELQKRAFVQRPDYATDYLPKLQEARKHLMNDEFMAWTPLGYRDYEVDDFEYDIKTGRFNFEITDTNSKKINANCKDFHFMLDKCLCLSYPSSLISMTKDGSYYIQKAQTCKVSEADALKFDNNKEDCALVWTFKVEKIIKMSHDGFPSEPVLYGKTTHLYLANKKTKEIYCDLSESLGASQYGFKSTKIIKDNSPKQTYHARGRMETCPLCLGSGDIKSWRDGSYNRCTTCGGKGWVIEHYW